MHTVSTLKGFSVICVIYANLHVFCICDQLLPLSFGTWASVQRQREALSLSANIFQRLECRVGRWQGGMWEGFSIPRQWPGHSCTLNYRVLLTRKSLHYSQQVLPRTVSTTCKSGSYPLNGLRSERTCLTHELWTSEITPQYSAIYTLDHRLP